MVRYNGRQKLLTSTLNTNQIGLKMSGTAPSVGTSISARRYTKRRVRDNLKFCGPVYYHGQLWSNNSGDSCVKKAPKNQSLAGGVGRINNPRTKCNIKCSLEATVLPLPTINNKQVLTLPLPTINNKVDLENALDTWISDNNTYQHPNKWDVSKVKDMSGLFDYNSGRYFFNEDIGDWDVSNVTNMERMFWTNQMFNQDISRWNVSNVTNMVRMFSGDNDGSGHKFNQDISTKTVTKPDGSTYTAWNVSNVTDMTSMFRDNNNFNQDIGNWNVSSVISMSNMFENADLFNQNLRNWDVSNITDFTNMFYRATAIKTQYASNTALPNTPIKANWASYWS